MGSSLLAAALRFFAGVLGYFVTRSAGQTAISKTAEREAEAVAQAPSSRKELLDTLNKGEF